MAILPDLNLSDKLLYWLDRNTVPTNIYIAVCGSFASTLPFLVYSQKIPFWLPIFVGISIWLTYSWQKNQANQAAGVNPTLGHSLALISLLLLFLFFGRTSESTTYVALGIAFILSVLYVKPWISFKAKRYSLRSLPYAKIWTVLTVWLLAVVVFPLTQFERILDFDESIASLAFISGQAAFILALIIPFDIRDLAVDQQEQHTFPMIFGVSISVRLSLYCILFTVITVLVRYALGYNTPAEIIGQLLALAISYYIVSRCKSDKKNSYYSIQIDGCLILQPVFIGMFSIF